MLLLAVAGDVAETYAQLKIINELSQPGAFLSWLAIGNNVKVVGLAFLIVSNGRGSNRLFAIAVGIYAGGRLFGFAVQDAGSLVPLSSLVAYMMFAIYCIGRATRRAYSISVD